MLMELDGLNVYHIHIWSWDGYQLRTQKFFIIKDKIMHIYNSTELQVFLISFCYYIQILLEKNKELKLIAFYLFKENV